ncbi:MAG: ABC transporter permease [Malacoplasma sp.]
MKMFKDIYNYRELLKTSVRKELRGKYKGSFFGVLWSFINPLLMVLVYAIVFPYLMNASIDNYLIYLIAGIIPWNFFTTVLNQGITTIRNNAGIINKVYFPREILPISVAASGLINFFISSIIILVFCICGGVGISWHLVLLPFIAILQFLFTLGLVFAFSAINVYIKDTEYIIAFLVNMGFYGTPILYQLDTFNRAPEIIIQIIRLNPFTHMINIYRDIFMYHQLSSIGSWLYLLAFALVSIFAGLAIFRKLEKGFAEEV